MSAPPLLRTVTDWYCPNCQATDRTLDPPLQPGEIAQRFHPCPRLHGLTAPMLPAGVNAKVEAVQRADYTGGDDVQYGDDRRAYMAVVTTRDDGNDVAVLAPTATGIT